MPALNRIWGATLALVITFTTVSGAIAGHPHWGGGGFGHGHHWGGGYGHYHGYGGYRSLGIYGPSVWGGYSGLGYGGWGYGSLRYSSIGYSSIGYRSWYARPFGYSSYYANYYVPRVTYFAPSAAYCIPSTTYYVPSYVPSVINVAPSCCVPSCCDNCLSDAQAPIDNGPALAPSGTAIYSLPVNAPTDASIASTIPASHLAAADAIFQAGGYRQAATAYAQLHVRYGSSDQIFERRFVAQVACGDFDQAAVVLASAQGAGFPIERLVTTTSDQSQLFAGHPDLVRAWTERLAQHALQVGGQRESLEMMATWLNVTGQPQRAGLFLALAERLSLEADDSTNSATSVAEVEELPLPPRSKSSLVSLEQ